MGIFKDENGRSYGDWTRRGQGRTSEHANDIVTTGDEKKWYEQTFWIIFFLVVIVTIAILGLVVVSYQMSQAVLAAQGTLG